MKNKIITLYRKAHFYWHQHTLPPHITQQLQDLIQEPEEKILFAGYIKSGNTWLRFLLFNYFNIVENKATTTLTYQELNQLQHDSLGATFSVKGNPSTFPYIVRTHHHNCRAFNTFSKCIYIYRNPLDTLISAYHFQKNRANPDFGNPNKKDFLKDIDYFVLHHLVYWQLHVETYLNRKNIFTTTYEKLQEDPLAELKKVIEYLEIPFNTEAATQSVAFSNFDSIQKMGRENNQTSGNGGLQFKGEFARKGQIGRYKEELKPQTILKASRIMKQYGF